MEPEPASRPPAAARPAAARPGAARPGAAGPDPQTAREVEAAVAARRELGPDYEEAVAAALAERVEQLAAIRSAELQRVAEGGSAQEQAEREARTQRFVLSIISLGAGVPITAIAATNVEPGLLGVAVAWAGIVAVNAVSALSARGRRRDR